MFSKIMVGLCCLRLMKGEKSNLLIRISRSKNYQKIIWKCRQMIRVYNLFHCWILHLIAGDIEVNPRSNRGKITDFSSYTFHEITKKSKQKSQRNHMQISEKS